MIRILSMMITLVALLIAGMNVTKTNSFGIDLHNKKTSCNTTRDDENATSTSSSTTGELSNGVQLSYVVGSPLELVVAYSSYALDEIRNEIDDNDTYTCVHTNKIDSLNDDMSHITSEDGTVEEVNIDILRDGYYYVMVYNSDVNDYNGSFLVSTVIGNDIDSITDTDLEGKETKLMKIYRVKNEKIIKEKI